MGIRTGRPRGAPLGNTNRLKYGRYSGCRVARRKEKNVLLRRARNLIRRIEMMAWSRKALRRTMERASCARVTLRCAAVLQGSLRSHLSMTAAPRRARAQTKLGHAPSPGMTPGSIRGSPPCSVVAMTNRQETAMPSAEFF